MDEDNDNNQLYKLYAQFLITFEYVSHLMRFGILYTLFPSHTEKQFRQNEILMESLTADQIRNKFMALIAEDYNTNTEVYKLTKSISNIYGRLIPIRNTFAHGTSFIGENSFLKEAKNGQLIIRHPKLKKGGLNLNFKKYEIGTLKLGIELFEKLKFAVVIITAQQNKKNSIQKSATYKPNRHLESTRLELEKYESKLNDLLN